jgi:glyoxylase-like metal-dependent hydrolase (beta-lactamase superfamily II)
MREPHIFDAGRPEMRVAPGIHRIGGDSRVNSYLLEEGGSVTIIDAGLPGFYRQLPDELAAMGRSLKDVRALVLTHGHSDHIGYAERVRTEQRVPVSVHESDAALARGEVPNPSKGLGRVRIGPLLSFMWFAFRRGGLRTPKLHEVSTFGDGATLDVPGSPKVILTPGHTPGSAALHAEASNALFVGDALATYAVTTGVRGPQVAPFTADPPQAVASLARLEDLNADIVLPGHGDVWTGGIAEAVHRVRAAFNAAR